MYEQSNIINTDDPNAIIDINNKKLTADKIIEKLSRIQNNPSDSAKRWIWELIQNAKDVKKSESGGVSIIIKYTDNKLSFSHNGKPFTMHNLISLVQQVSSKNSTNKDEAVTGKFGTGFIATHLLSRIIELEGLVKYKEGYKQFEMNLDRRGDSSEELLERISDALDYVRDIDNQNRFKDVEYDPLNQLDAMDTVFTYPLETDEQHKAVKQGLNDLVNTLPLTLANLPEIRSLTVIDAHRNIEETYSCSRQKVNEFVATTKVELINKQEGENRNFSYVTYTDRNLALTCELKDLESKEIQAVDGKKPNLYRDFPLIGSDKFYFPFILNGFRFTPTEDRDGILLHSRENKQAEENRKIIEDAFEVAKEFIKYLVEFSVKDIHLLGLSRLPNEKWADSSKQWYTDLQTSHRDWLKTNLPIETEDGSIKPLGDLVLPNYGSDEATKLGFYDLVLDFYGMSLVPRRDIVLQLIKTTGPKEEMSTWGDDFYFDLSRLVREVENLESIDNLSQQLSSKDSKLWMGEFHLFILHNQDKPNYFSTHKIFPNLNGSFRLFSILKFLSKESPIDDYFLDILGLVDNDIRGSIAFREHTVSPTNKDPFTLNKLSELVTSQLSKTANNDDLFLRNENALDILARIVAIQSANSSYHNFRHQVFNKAKSLFQLEQNVVEVEYIKDFRFNKALELIIKLINKQIEQNENIAKLSITLGLSERETLQWLNEYYSELLKKNDFDNLIEYGNIIPNRFGIFCAYVDLHNAGTTETPLDDSLVKILGELDSDNHWNHKLIHNSITIKCKHLSFEELGNAITNAINDIRSQGIDEENTLVGHKSSIIELLNWCAENPFFANQYLQPVVDNKDRLWVEVTMTPEIINLVKDQESLEVLQVIQDSGISKDEVTNLLGMIRHLDALDIDGLAFIKKEIKEKVEQEEEFRFLKSIGENMENILKEAFADETVEIDPIHKGYGPNDFEIRGREGKSLYIEMKSYAFASKKPIKLSTSQVQKANKNPDDYYICTIERPPNNEEASIGYLKENIRFKDRMGRQFDSIANDINEFVSFEKSTSAIRLVFNHKDKPKVEVDQSLLLADALNYQRFIDIVKLKLGLL